MSKQLLQIALVSALIAICLGCSTKQEPIIITQKTELLIPSALMIKCQPRLIHKSGEMAQFLVVAQENNARFDECAALHSRLIEFIYLKLYTDRNKSIGLTNE